MRSEADIFKYFDDSEVMYSAIKEHPKDYLKMLFGYQNDTPYFFEKYYTEMNNWDREYDSNLYNDSHTIIRINAFIRLFSFGVFHIHTLLFCLFSMIGLTALFRVAREYFIKKQNALLICIFLLPSVLFWSSGVLKEAILLLGIGLLFYSGKQIIVNQKRIFHAMILIFSLIILFYIKFYVLFVLLPVFLAWISNEIWDIKRKVLSYGFIIAFGSILVFNSEKIIPSYNFKSILVQKQKDFKGLSKFMDSGSQFELTDLQPSFTGIVKVVPEAILNCFIQPIPKTKGSIFQWSAIAENVFILFLLALAIASRIRKKTSFHNSKNLFYLGISFTLLLFIIIGLTTPVAGALVRYKVPALPFLSLALLLLIDLEAIIKRVPFLKYLQ